MNLTYVLRRIVEFGRDFAGASYGALGVVRHDGGFSEYVEAGFERPDRDPTGERAIRQVVNNARTVRRTQPERLIGIPIHTDTDLVGAVCLWGRPDGGEFTRRDEDIAAAAAAAAGGAIQQVHLLRRAARREEWQLAATAVCTALASGKEPAATLQQVVEGARRAANASAAAVMRPPEGTESVLRMDVVDGDENGTSVVGLCVPVVDSAAGTAYLTGQPVVANGKGERAMGRPGAGDIAFPSMTKDLDSTVAAPVIVAGERLGVLAVSRFSDAEPFTDDDAQLVQGFAIHAAMVLGYSRVEEDRRRLAVVQDRRRIARDLHDVVAQRLYVVGLQLRTLINQSPDADTKRSLSKIVEELDHAGRDVRASIFTLEEPRSADGTVRAELWHRVREFSDVLGYEPWVSLDGPLDAAVPDSVLPDLYAAIREALSNVARHSSATSVQVEVAVDDGGQELTLTVDDNGTGVPRSLIKRSGLANLEARAAHWAGTLVVRPGRHRGTHLEWRILLPQHGAAAERAG